MFESYVSSSMKYILKNHYMTIITKFIAIIFLYQCESQLLNPSINDRSRQLNSFLQNYAYKAFENHPLIGKKYEAKSPSNLTGIEISVIRLKCGGLLNKGIKSYREFEIPIGVMVQPYAMRLALVYHNLGNWSSYYYPLHGFTYLTPIIGLLAYNAANLSATNLNELDIIASKLPILIKFEDRKPFHIGYTRKRVWFDLSGLPEFKNLEHEHVYSTYRQGHFSIVVNTTELVTMPPSPSPNIKKSHMKYRVWRIVVGVVSGFIVLVMLALLLMCLCGYVKKKEVEKMERRAEDGEPLQMARVGLAQALVALSSRTLPVLEDEYMS